MDTRGEISKSMQQLMVTDLAQSASGLNILASERNRSQAELVAHIANVSQG